MTPSFKIKSLLAPVAFAAAAALSPTIASADAVAQAYLDITSFTLAGTGGAFTVLVFTDSGDVSASINGGTAATDSFNGTGTFTLNESVGPDAASYSPTTALVGAPTQNYVGSYSFLDGGDPLSATGAQATVDNTVSLTPGGTGTAQSNVNLTSTFLIDVSDPGTIFTVAFDADAFYRTMLAPFGSSGTANAAYSWTINVLDSGGNTVFDWSPDGLAGGIIGGTEVSDVFDLSQGAGINFGGLNFFKSNTGSFEAKTDAFSAGLYSLTIQHNANADATLRVPEPGALSLLALGLLGLGFVSRRRNQA